MEAFDSSIFPLAGTSQDELRSLCVVLWRWDLCEDCKAGRNCQSGGCPWQRSSRLGPFFSYYRDTTASYVPDLIPGSVQSLANHKDLLAVINTIKSSPHMQRAELTDMHFSQKMTVNGVKGLPPLTDQNRAFSLAARVMTMVNCSAENQSDGLLELGALPVTWRSDTSFSDFIDAAFPVRAELSLGQDSPLQQLMPDRRARWTALTAKQLKRVAGLEFVPTDNLQNHLRLDLEHGKVEVYHHTSVLKEHLTSSVTYDYHENTGQAITEYVFNESSIIPAAQITNCQSAEATYHGI
jgi:hypothetical protein